MLRALKQLFGRPHAEQLTLDFAPTVRADAAAQMLERLRACGLRRITRLRFTRNRNVMVSFSGPLLRIHEGFRSASEDVLRAIVQFVEGRSSAERRDARRVIIDFPIVVDRGARRKRVDTFPEDRVMAEKLALWHEQYNVRHFEGALRPIPIRVSRRMKSRLGHYTPATGAEPAEIAISRRHVRRHGWPEALHTLLHEMVHQWQDETGQPIDHGAGFRAKARLVGVTPFARRAVDRSPERVAS